MGAAASIDVDATKATGEANVKILSEFFDTQTKMATGQVDDAKMAEFAQAFAGYFAPSIKWAIGNDAAMTGEGDFGAMMGVVGAYWMGIKNNAARDIDCAVDLKSGGKKILWTQEYDCEIGETKMDGFKVCHAITMNDESKITDWHQGLDTKAMADARSPGAANVAAFGAMLGKWGAGDDEGFKAGCTEDCVMDCTANMVNSDMYKVYNGHAGVQEWLDFLKNFDFKDFTPTGITAVGDDKVLFQNSYTPTYKPTGKSASVAHGDTAIATFKDGKCAHMRYFNSNAASLDAIIKAD